MEQGAEVIVCPLCKKGKMKPGSITRIRRENEDLVIMFCTECSAVLSTKRIIR